VNYWNTRTCYDWYSIYRSGFVTGFSLSLYWQSSFGFGIQYTILAFCGCGMAISFYLYILLGFINMITLSYTIVLPLDIITYICVINIIEFYFFLYKPFSVVKNYLYILLGFLKSLKNFYLTYFMFKYLFNNK
jgi:hypothetical protein